MNSKIKNYVDVLFNDVPKTHKASELKEEILSTLNDHFEEHIREGKSENQAYTEALGDMGNIDDLLNSVTPDKDVTKQINQYRQKKARNTSIAVMLYILGAAFLCGLPAISSVFGWGTEDKMAIVGFIILLCFVAIATSLLVYTKISIPQEVEPYITKHNKKFNNINTNTEAGRRLSAILQLLTPITVVVYLIVSFTTGAWYITWLIFPIAGIIRQAIILFSNSQSDEN